MGANFISERFRDFCPKFNNEQEVSYHYHQSNRQVESSIKVINYTMNKCIEVNNDIHLILL